jgi:FlaA1/EpsC-like NDP-sugar epimerase
MTVIFGGTGTLGKALVRRIYSTGKPIHIVSRCGLRQAEMRKEFPNCKYHLGDVTDPYSLPFIPTPGHVFNLAAMKHVERGQDNHEYCVNVNYNGVINTYSWAHTHAASSYTQSSTDKAIEPINTYGKAKSLAEDYLLSRMTAFPISIFNWGNVLGSNGSVIHKFVESLRYDGTINITDTQMTRFFVMIEDVAAFMWENRGRHGYHVPPMKSAEIVDLAIACAKYIGMDPHEIKFKEIGNRGGEKLHEKLNGITSEECERYTEDELLGLVRRALG